MNVITNNNIKCTTALAVLHNVDDPEIGLNIVDLGLIYQIDFDDVNNKVLCSMTLTTQFCPMSESITDAVQFALQSAFGDATIEVELIFDPEWTPEMISVDGQLFLNK